MGMAANPLGAHQAGELSLAKFQWLVIGIVRRAAAPEGRWHACSDVIEMDQGLDGATLCA